MRKTLTVWYGNHFMMECMDTAVDEGYARLIINDEDDGFRDYELFEELSQMELEE